MAGERNRAGQMSPRSSLPPGAYAARGTNLVSLTHVGPVGVALAARLLQAGFIVLGRDVAEGCLRTFQAAGGELSTGATRSSDIAWSIECQERSGVRPEILSWLTEQRAGYGRPRLELSGASRSDRDSLAASAGTLTIHAGRERSAASPLRVALEVNPRGLQLVVHGERPLFEAALPLLTVLADRVLYAGGRRNTPPITGT